MHDTIFALSSGRPPAAVSIIRVSGPRAHEAGERIAGTLPEPRMAGVRELRHPETDELLDEALVLKFAGPASSTGEDVLEFQCHGGRAVVDSLLAVLGCFDEFREARPGEFTRRAFENGRIDLTEAEGLADLIEAETEAQRKAAVALAEGGLSKQIDIWRQRLLELSARAEQAIDYDEDDTGAGSGLLNDCRGLAADLQEWLDRPRIETLKDGVRVVVAGPPNSGKSSLLNAIVGSERAIVTDIPGTTRDHIEVLLAISGLPILLTDTAGLRETGDAVEAIGVARTSALIGSADVLLWLGEPQAAPRHPRLIRVHAQSDRPERQQLPSGSVAVSSVTGRGIAELLEQIAANAITVLPGEGAIALNRRQAELIEEAAAALADSRNTELVILAESLRRSRSAFDRLTGRAGVEDVLDALFGRFCLGK
jgi:tRNA modification GTPase